MRKILIELKIDWDGYDDVSDELIIEDAIQAKCDGVGWKVCDAVIAGSGENHVDDERALEPIQDAIYATGRFTTADCDKIANGIIDYLRTAGMNIYKSPNS